MTPERIYWKRVAYYVDNPHMKGPSVTAWKWSAKRIRFLEAENKALLKKTEVTP